ncbi:MAG: homocysteine S-methyltransferase family protein [Clostridia bacterium]|nr:homocysteine S-methyltransferase family protein [Clostridia bacterium]MCI1999124.1 homocysteine S-methyltransferase family protein [Clostridia bacterium]MCI2013874.1 homocysteine S-methyltransferase family protein [Clostridia bacterium]
MGTMLQNAGLKLGERPESLCISSPEIITDIHRQYIKAGSRVVYTNTFGANRHKLEGTGLDVREVIDAAVKCAGKATKGTDAFVALDIGPIGELLEPSGTLAFEEAYDIFKEMVTEGEKSGCDLVVFETMTDLYEVKAGVLAAKENTKLPIVCTMTFEETGRTFTGCTIESMAAVLEGLGVDAIGINCSLGPDEIFPLAKRLVDSSSLPIVIKANAGLPNPITNKYDITPEKFAEYMIPYAKEGIKIMGGCCGTTPEYIKEIIKAVSGNLSERKSVKRKTVLCTPSKFVDINGVRIIGERINPTGKKRFQQALKENDMGYIAERAIEQADAGADILDVNVGMPGINEKEMMIKVVKLLQSVCDLPLQIDSSDADAIEAGLRVFNGKAIVNSVNGEPEKMDKILPIVKKYGAAVIGLCMDSDGIPKTAEKRFEIAKRILDKALYYGIPREDVFIDCLTLTVSAQQEQAQQTLKAVRRVKEELGLHTVLGVSNISFGLPAREYITTSFLVQAMANGLDLPIVNPNQQAIMDAIYAFKVLSGEDKNSEKYIERFAGRTETKTEQTVIRTVKADEKHGDLDIAYAVSRGLKEDAARITKELLKEKSELEIINNLLIPALDKIGERYEKQEIFLPQLINSATASCEAFEVIKKSILSKGSESVSKGKIVLATVKGDIHDIGKNIVKVILENYGYQVIDLGRDVPIDTVVQAAIKENVKFVGLSALMTTTLKSMKETIDAIRKSGHECKIVVGGAVLTPEYAKEIGADFYAKDAKQTVDFAKQVLG